MKGRFHSAAQGSANAGPDKGPAQRKGHTVNKRLADAHDADKRDDATIFLRRGFLCFHIDCKSSPHLPGARHGKDGKKDRIAKLADELGVDGCEALMDAHHDKGQKEAAQKKARHGAARSTASVAPRPMVSAKKPPTGCRT